MDVKRSFTIMPKAELRAYVLQNPEDNEAFYELSDRIKANARPLNPDELPAILQSKCEGGAQKI